MTELDDIIAMQNESAKQSVHAQKKLARLQKDIKQGKTTTHDPVLDFCIVNYGIPTPEQTTAVYGMMDGVAKGKEYLVHTVVEGRIDDRETFHSPTKWAKATVEYLRFGKAKSTASINNDGITIPGKYVWCRRQGKEMFDIGLGTIPFSTWSGDNNVLITPFEIASTRVVWDMQLLKLHDMPEDNWNKNFKYEFEPLRAKSLIYTGKAIETQFEKISVYLQDGLYQKAKTALRK